MSFKKKLMALAAAGALTAVGAVPAMALENEFHGMYKMFGYYTNTFSGKTAGIVKNGASESNFFEQRARLQYIAKANDDLKLVTHFELDSRFGGVTPGYKGTASGNDSGQLDADSLTLETKSVYLDFNCPITGTNFKAGLQPWADAYNSLFLLADMTGVYATKKFDPLTVSAGWFRYNDDGSTAATSTQPAGKLSNDLFIVDGKFAINKDMTVGASYYAVDSGTATNATGFKNLHVLGLNAALKFGPATVNPFFAYQLGTTRVNNNTYGFLGGTTAKVKAGPGNVNFAFAYISGDEDQRFGGKDFQTINNNTTYFNAANMWILVRSGQAVNSSSSILNNDMTVGGRGLTLVTAGYEGTMGKVFYNANVGYAMTSEQRKNANGSEQDSSIGTEINAQVGYKLFDNLAVSLAGAYVFLGDGMGSTTGNDIISGFGATGATNPFMTNVQLSYAF